MSWDGRIRADARHLPIASESVQCIVTSPPYWGLRDYGNEGQIGMEATPRDYVNTLREVSWECWRVLRKDGTLWLNLGDTYNSGGGTVGAGKAVYTNGQRIANLRQTVETMKPKNLCGIPWRVAFALQEDGWYLRSDIIWHKPNPMPESVTDRPTKAHEYIFLLTKSERYYYNADSIREPHAFPEQTHSVRKHSGVNYIQDIWSGRAGNHENGRNKRSVWTFATKPYPEAHYATFPPALIEPCILAGSRRGDLVLDPFFGSGTVGKVCEQVNRRWIGCDLGYQHLQIERVTNVQRELFA